MGVLQNKNLPTNALIHLLWWFLNFMHTISFVEPTGYIYFDISLHEEEYMSTEMCRKEAHFSNMRGNLTGI